MKTEKTLNLAIGILILTALYTTSTLWISQTSISSLSEVLTKKSNIGSEKSEGNVLLATRYAVGKGDGFFSLYYPDETGQSYFIEEANDVLNELLKDSNVVSVEIKVDWKEILSTPTVVMQYDFLVNGKEYLSQYVSNLKDEQMPNYFDYITIVPAKNTTDRTYAFFINSKTNESICFYSNKSILSSNFYKQLQTKDEELMYISTSERAMSDIISRNIFLPQWAELPYHYSSLKEEAVFGKVGAVNQVEMEQVIKGFFNNFSIDWNNSTDSNNFLFSDNQTVVKYEHNTQMLEYFNYNAYNNINDELGLLEGYQLSCSFLGNDSSLETDVYLANIRTNNEETTYFFNYSVNDIPLVFSEEIRNIVGSAYAIEVTIKNGSIKNYKRYMVNYKPLEEKDKQVTVQFIDALDTAINTYHKNIEEKVITDVSNIYLGYYVDSSVIGSDDEVIGLNWFINLYDHIFVTSTEQ